jgi:hypothetical protein
MQGWEIGGSGGSGSGVRVGKRRDFTCVAIALIPLRNWDPCGIPVQNNKKDLKHDAQLLYEY